MAMGYKCTIIVKTSGLCGQVFLERYKRLSIIWTLSRDTYTTCFHFTKEVCLQSYLVPYRVCSEMKIAAVVVLAGLVVIASAFSIRRPVYYEKPTGNFSCGLIYGSVRIFFSLNLQNLLVKWMTTQWATQ